MEKKAAQKVTRDRDRYLRILMLSKVYDMYELVMEGGIAFLSAVAFCSLMLEAPHLMTENDKFLKVRNTSHGFNDPEHSLKQITLVHHVLVVT